jgi:serine/threonine protein phosphatase PrpC
MTGLRAAGITDPGRVRAQNQDAFYVAEDLVLIADGMGGYAGGEVAAAIAAEVVGARFSEDGSANGLEVAVADANRQIFERGVEPGLEGMGTTLVAAALVGSGPVARVLVANVGDSRAYLLRDGSLRQLTEDHSVAAELVRLGRLEKDEGQEHPGRHVLTRALGVDRDVAPDLIEVEPEPGDRLLLCSDGLSNELDDDQILALLGVGEPSDAARSLVAAANAHGGLDNVTAVVADVALDDDAPDGTGRPAAAVGVGAVAAGSAAAPGASPAPASPPSATSAVTSTVRAVASTEAGAASTRLVTAVPSSPSVAVRPVLTARERRRRRREDRRARRAYNKWVSFRGALFLLAVVAVLVGGYVVLRWYGTSNYVVAIHGRRVVILQGQPGGFLWWPQRVVVAYHFGLHQVPQSEWPSFRAGQQESTLKDAMHFVANWHLQWQRMTGNLPTTTTTTSTTTTLLSTTGGT